MITVNSQNSSHLKIDLNFPVSHCDRVLEQIVGLGLLPAASALPLRGNIRLNHLRRDVPIRLFHRPNNRAGRRGSEEGGSLLIKPL